MSCNVIGDSSNRVSIKFDNYRNLHSDGKRLIESWFRKSKLSIDQENVFEAFIFLWISFNGWYSCTTEQSRDYISINSLCADNDINNIFNDLMLSDDTFNCNVTRFHSYLPIFDVKDLKEKNLINWNRMQINDRQLLVQRYLNNHAEKFYPRCWQYHHDQGNNCPIDFPHLIRGIYKARCNLFHGDKSSHSEMDKNIVESAYDVLCGIFNE
ncbi:MAG: hypothetical protein ACOCRK_11725, partial [bacterium]